MFMPTVIMGVLAVVLLFIGYYKGWTLDKLLP